MISRFYLQIDQLSGGYKAVLSVIADIAKRLSMANPDSQNPLEEDAVILIDEGKDQMNSQMKSVKN